MNLKLLCSIVLCFAAAAQDEPWKPAEMVTAGKMAEELKTPDAARHILYVGFPILYKGAHIKDAGFAGPCSKPDGLDLLAASLKDVPLDAEVVIYCGCCPFARCPNIRPAYRRLKEMGYTNIKVLDLPTNLHTDWVEKGYPTETQTK